MIGSQEPRIQIEPERASTDGDDAALLMEAYAYSLNAWQRLILNCWLGKDENGIYNVSSAGLSVPRQNGKNVCIEALEFFGLIMNGEKFIHTAHQVRTAKKSFRRLEQIFTDRRHPEIMETVKNIRYTNGEECIELINGGTVEFLARSRQAARGFDGVSRIIFDEAQELTDDQMEATMATLAASKTGTRQMIFAGTPPYPNCPGEVFRRRRQACLTDPGPYDAWHEWSVAAESVGDIRAGDRSVWYMTNPALGTWLTEEFTENEFTTLSMDGFARERLGWWSPVLTEAVDKAINQKAWEECKSSEKKPEGKTAYGVKFTPDGAMVALAGAVIPKEGPARISLIEKKQTGQGIQWLSDWLNERSKSACCVVIDGRNGVDVLVDKIAGKTGSWKVKNSVIRPGVRDVIASVSMLTDALNERAVTWYEFQDELNDSALSTVKRPIGGGWGFGGENPAPIEAAALALWGAKTSKRDPDRKMRIG